MEKSAEIALELAWKGATRLYFLRRQLDRLRLCSWHRLAGARRFSAARSAQILRILVGQKVFADFEVVEVSPPYDTSDITALVGVRVVVEALGSMVAHGKLGSHKSIINKPVTY